MKAAAHKQSIYQSELHESPAYAGSGRSNLHAPIPSFEPYMYLSDQSLVEALKMRDSGAVHFAVETYAPKLYRYAVYQTGDEQGAEDIVSEVITRMLEKIDNYNYTGAPFQTWLFAIARNLIADLYRFKKKANIISMNTPDGEREAEDIASDDTTIEHLADRDALMRAMSHLTDEQRQIVTLRLVEGWEPAEIASFLGRSIDSVKSLQYRALQAMKKTLESEMDFA
ncbi:MAG: RNA polymerase sigma factor [Chloroflexia bacterium]